MPARKRSDIDWYYVRYGVLCPSAQMMPGLREGISQHAWERSQRVLRAYRTGQVTYSRIGEVLGVSRERVRQMVNRAEFLEQRGWKSPLGDYFAQGLTPNVVRKLSAS